jgi:hypothetical protein
MVIGYGQKKKMTCLTTIYSNRQATKKKHKEKYLVTLALIYL